MNEDIAFIARMNASRNEMANEIFRPMNAKKEMPFDGEIEDDGFITAYSSVAI